MAKKCFSAIERPGFDNTMKFFQKWSATEISHAGISNHTICFLTVSKFLFSQFKFFFLIQKTKSYDNHPKSFKSSLLINVSPNEKT